MGRITALSRFISRSVETAMPIFGALRKGGKFAWTPECEEAFLRLKAMLAAPPVLSHPVTGREGEQFPVYFVSKVLQSLETRYQKIEKAALALVTASRRLHPYFQNFDIIVLIDLPIRQVLRKLDLAGRMVAWSIQLSEFDISFESRGHIKAQVLADFLTKLTLRGDTTREEGEWYLSVDGSSNHAGSGAGIILEGPTSVVIEQYLHFEFKASNNQAEYEALLAGMRLAWELEARKLTAKSDLKFIIG
ncbi:Retrovirus-related Pol polyprotein from transposon 17.6, partial [Mucuna pruriens]